MIYIRFFLGVIWYTLGAMMLCGLGISLCRHLFLRMLGRPGRGIVWVTSVIGTPIHELGHALMCLVFGHRITRMRLWSPLSSDGTLGSVTHRYNRRNPYQILGLLFIGFGPILLGTVVLTLTLRCCFPAALHGYADAMSAQLSGGAEAGAVILEGLRLVPRIGRELVAGTDRPLWVRIVGGVVLLSVSLHMELSPADVRSFGRALPLYGILVLAVTVVCAILGTSVMTTVTGALAQATAYMTALFAVVFATSALELLLALPFWVLRRLFR